MTFSFLFSGKPELRQDNPLHKGRPPDVHDQGLCRLHELLSGQKSGKNIHKFCPNTQV